MGDFVGETVGSAEGRGVLGLGVTNLVGLGVLGGREGRGVLGLGVKKRVGLGVRGAREGRTVGEFEGGVVGDCEGD